ncbi:MAG: sulfate ABC transporter permease subunit CysW [Thermoguttaceae bacterium]|nr:sulfate ABC transporter permease subunit CysW [Thermoguttaceae bacterium]
MTEEERKIFRRYNEHRKSILRSTTEPRGVQLFLIALTVLFMSLFLFVPLISIFYEAFKSGAAFFFRAISDRAALSALKMTLLATGISVPANLIFGLCAAWCIGKFQFWGKSVLVSLIDIPFAISPVIAGLLFIFLFGTNSALGLWLRDHGFRILYAPPSVVIVTIFVTFPFVVREVLPVIQAQGTEEEQAARVLGARGWHIFWRVTLPNIRWALLYGIILCNARAMGEFGAVMVVVGNSPKTNTLPLHINALYQGYADPAAPFAVATLLALMAILTLVLKCFVEWKMSSAESDA